MHFEILVEGESELTALSILMPKMIGDYDDKHTWKIHKHQGIGKIPESWNDTHSKDRTLLGQLPKKIRAYSKVADYDRVVIVLLEKCQWAKKIPPNMNINSNLSPSFNFFKNCLLELSD